jgi:hypothetical protein
MKSLCKFGGWTAVLLAVVMLLPVLLGTVCVGGCVAAGGMGHGCCRHDGVARLECVGCGVADVALMMPEKIASVHRSLVASMVTAPDVIAGVDGMQRRNAVAVDGRWRSPLAAAVFVLRI